MRLKHLILVILALVCVATPTRAQLSPSNVLLPVKTEKVQGRKKSVQVPPHIVTVPKEEFTDLPYHRGSKSFYYRTGNFSVPVSKTAELNTGLPRTLNTKQLTEDGRYWDLPVHRPVQTPYGSLYPEFKETKILTLIRGHGAKFGRVVSGQFELEIEPQTIQVEIGESDYIKVGENEDQRTVYLKPGRWAFTFSTEIESIESDSFSWHAKGNPEAPIVGPRFGSVSSWSRAEGVANEVGSVPLLSGLVNLGVHAGKLLWEIGKPPDMKMSAATELYFRITHIQAKYISEPIPDGPATSGFEDAPAAATNDSNPKPL
jgi:hypothetical protein